MRSDLTVADVMTRTARSLPDSTTLSEAYAWLMGEGVRGAPVLDDEGTLCGVVSTSDLLAALAPVLDPQGDVDAETLASLRELTLSELCERSPITCPSTMALDDACKLMLRKRVRRLVVEDKGEVVGVLSATDLVYAYAHHDDPPLDD